MDVQQRQQYLDLLGTEPWLSGPFLDTPLSEPVGVVVSRQ